MISLITNTKSIFIALLILSIQKIFTKNVVYYIVLLIFTFFIISFIDKFRLFELGNILNVDFSELILIPYSNDHKEYFDFFYSRNLYDFNLDSSTNLRIATYAAVIKSISPISFFIGNGPGFYGKAVDSSILRIFGETGLFVFISFVLYLNILLSFLKNYYQKAAVIFLFLTVDILFSLRFMSMLILIYFLVIKRSNEKI